MGDKGSGIFGRNVKCRFCGCAFVPEVQTQAEGDIEYTFFRCGYCGKAYLVSVTDGELRKGIAEYAHRMGQHKGSVLSEEEQARMQKLKTDNIERARALMRAYIREERHDGD